MKVLYKNELFTRLRAAGKPEHADLSMEKSVGHIRKIVGKVERPGMDKKMEHVCEKIPTLPTHEHVGQRISARDQSKSKNHKQGETNG